MSGIFLIQHDGGLVEMNEAKYDSEDLLQGLLAKYPSLLAGDQMESSNPRRWLLIRREMPVPDEENGSGRWSLDHLFLDQDAIPTLIEVKRSSDTRIRREVVGQMLDYAANAVMYWPVEDFRSHFERECESGGVNPDEQLRRFIGPETRPDDFWLRAKTNLQAGKIRMVFVADVIPLELRRIVEFLNEQMDPAEVLAVEIKQYVGQGMQTLVPRVIGQTAEAEKKKSTGGREKRNWDENGFFARIAESRPELVEPQRELLSRMRAIPGLSPRFDSSGGTAMYKVWLDAADTNVLWVYENGGLYVRWGMLRKILGNAIADGYRDQWQSVAPIRDAKGQAKSDGAMVDGGLMKVSPTVVAEKLSQTVTLANQNKAGRGQANGRGEPL